MGRKTIKTEGTRIDPPRNVHRLWLDVSTTSANGCSIEGHAVAGLEKQDDGTYKPRTTEIEVYADRLDDVLARVRTAEHEHAYKQACAAHEHACKRYRIENKKPPDADISLIYNGTPEMHLALFGFRTGIPPLTSCDVVNPTTGEKMPAANFTKLDADAQREWYVDAPATPMNQAQRANEHLANAIAKAMERAGQVNAENRPSKQR